MKILDADNRFFQGEDGETITFKISSANTRFMVTYWLDGATGAADETQLGSGKGTFSIKLDKADHDPSALQVFFHFVNSSSSGGFYTYVFSGDKGGDPFGRTVKQAGGEDVTKRDFTFDVA